MRKLEPPLNYRWTNRRCCSNCKYWTWVDNERADYECKRDPEHIAGDWNALEPEFHICDRWQGEKK